MKLLFSNPIRRCRFLLSVFVSCIIAMGIPLVASHPISASSGSTQIAQINPLLQTGIQHYQAGQYTAAIDSWNQAITTPSDRLQQALLWSNLSLAHQHLGHWPQAETAIANSLALLDDFTQTAAAATESVVYLETRAKALNTQGRLQWAKGDIQSALVTWRETTATYRQADHERGVILSLINQAKALQSLGFHVQSKTILETEIVHLLTDEQLDAPLRAKGLWNLGNAQRQFGSLDDSRKTLKQSWEVIQAAHLDRLQAPVLLDQGNTERALGNRTSAIGKADEADNHRQAALQAYTEAAKMARTPMTHLQADLNRLSLLVELQQWSEATTLWPNLQDAVSLPPSRTGIYAQLNFAKSLTALMQADPEQVQLSAQKNIKNRFKTKISTRQPTWDEIHSILVHADEQAQGLEDAIAQSYAIGQRGELHELDQQWSRAEALTQQALNLTTLNDYPNGRYRWQWQQGRLLKQQGKQQDAVEAYRAAVDTLDQVRSDLQFINTDVQFSFRDNVEPVYRELVELLLSDQGDDPAGTQPSEQNLELAIEQIDSLQLSELENFLRCSLAATTPITQFETADNTAILYPILLENRIGVISQFQHRKQFTSVAINKDQAEATLATLQRDLSIAPNRTPHVIDTAKEVYQWLIGPIASELEANGIDTLVFVLDGALRNIPMAVLHDGEGYLIEKYAIAIAPEIELFHPAPLPDDLTVFTGGVGQSQEIENLKFEPIEKLSAELDEISRLLGPQPPIVDQKFKGETLQEHLSTGDFSGIHIKTHGVFSSDPEETYIVAYKELIRGQALGNLIQVGSRQGATPIELLVLSSCSTAAGDNRAILGLAGIAVRAGAHSTLSTLWEAQDTPNTQLMIQFYQELKQSGMTRAHALRQAQLGLINSGYRAPHLWATYVLVGNWL